MLALKNLLFTVFVPGTVGVYVPLLLVADRPVARGLTLPLAIAALILGCAVYAWCVWDFATFGRATPFPADAPGRLVVRGLYRLTRNPMYVGVLTVILGIAILYRDGRVLAYALGTGLVFHLMIIVYEEPVLARRFGAEYGAYRSRVARWLPGLRRDA